jgi:hypothetical protein
MTEIIEDDNADNNTEMWCVRGGRVLFILQVQDHPQPSSQQQGRGGASYCFSTPMTMTTSNPTPTSYNQPVLQLLLLATPASLPVNTRAPAAT